MNAKPLRGLTLIELMIAVALVAILLAVAAPDFREGMQRRRLQSASAELVGAVQLARAEAVRTNRRAVLCRSSDGSSCSNDDAIWPGWIVFVDTNGDGVRANTEPVIKGGSFENIAVIGSAAITAAGQRIVFRGDGTARGSDGRSLMVATLAVCAAVARPTQNVRDVSLAFGTRTTVRARATGGVCAAPADS